MGKLESPELLRLLNIVEKLYKDNQELREENKALKDEINRLKGEKETPKYKQKNNDSKGDSAKRDISSENERKGRKDNSGESNTANRKTNRRKKKGLPIHDTKVIEIDRAKLPEDAVFKGHSKKVIQGIEIKMYNILVKREVYHSSTKGYFIAEMPEEYKIGYSPEFQNVILEMKYKYDMTETNILGFLQDNNFVISAGTINKIILKNGNDFSPERESIFKAGIKVSKCIQTDSTECSENGIKKQVHVFGSDLFSVFYTKDDRKRITIIDILRCCDKEERVFALNDEFFEIIKQKGVAEKHQEYLKKYSNERLFNHSEIKKILSPFDSKKNLSSLFYEVAYIAGYHIEEGYPIAQILLTDDSSVYDKVFLLHALCWIHEGRHFKKLNPLVIEFRELLDDFITQFWNYYHSLLDYKSNPNTQLAKKLYDKFDSLFTKVTPYDDLNDRIQKLYLKKEQLLVVLEYPSLPLHNNGCELLARIIARFRDICLHTVSKAGTEARDTMYSIFQTAEKLGISSKNYIIDRISGKYNLPSLAEMILNFMPP